ncbi:MAG: hypothetical protein L6243_05070 [Candidatus Altiarchaeales archaeon]|nr:hypothetical protein [Candidatus Altiarchaeota archaeon]MCG2782942.1 hypothetical protein [Candidatus Altiarchaeales archaeon]
MANNMVEEILQEHLVEGEYGEGKEIGGIPRPWDDILHMMSDKPEEVK